jgi:hypothetical protein
MSHPFNDPFIRDWLFGSYQISDSSSLVLDNAPIVLTEGAIPFSREDIGEFLKNRGFSVFNLNARSRPSSGTLVIGQRDWNENLLEDLITERTGQTLKIYSQEMFLAYILTGEDPFDSSRKLLDKFAWDHPALEYLSERGFDWPSAFATRGEGDIEFDETPWPKVGLLKHMGYKVGKYGLKKEKQRQEILRKVYISSNLPLVKSRSYMAEWGKARSCQRLQKMANSLATFCRNAKRRSKPPKLAINHWETDLRWMYRNFYRRDHCNFSWPSTIVD